MDSNAFCLCLRLVSASSNCMSHAGKLKTQETARSVCTCLYEGGFNLCLTDVTQTEEIVSVSTCVCVYLLKQ